ncbi:MAG: serine hydrolase [Planctomycetes bacterium]|nr:serine hydrolase [Planctomycetota bacterium]
MRISIQVLGLFLLAFQPLTRVAVAAEAAHLTPALSRNTLPGQIEIDPNHPQWLQRHGGRHVFICGPGDPEDFLYAGRRQPDGTRDGDQLARIARLAEHGGNCIYMQIVRSHGGDAKGSRDPQWMLQNPFVDGDPVRGLDEDILNQWDQWFSLMDRHEILIYLFFYDDSARIWDTGATVGPQERAFVETIVKKFMHHKNLIWVVGEESEERYTTARVQALARIIRDTDRHGHLVGDHHLSGTTFKAWQPDGALNHFAMQLRQTDDAAHAGAIEALQKAAGRYQVIYAESTAMRTDVDGMRSHAWAVAMAGMMPMLLRMDIATTPVEALQQCRHLQRFFEATDFWTMSAHDELAHAQTRYVLADPGYGYIAYADHLTGRLGIKDLPAGTYAATWLDCRTGKQVRVELTLSAAGDQAFDKPAEIGDECALSLRRHAVGSSPERVKPAAQGQPPAQETPTANRAPVVEDQHVTTPAGQQVSIYLTFEDEDGPGPYVYTILRPPGQGTFWGENNDRVYTPKPGFTGNDEFTWKVNDGRVDSQPARVVISVGGAVQSTPAPRYFPPPDSEGGWRGRTDDTDLRSAGLHRRKLDAAFDFVRTTSKNGGLLVLHDGWLVYERYFGKGHRDALCNLASCGKSFTSIAVGILMAERPDLFPDGLDQKVFTPQFFPPEAFPLSDPRKADITLGQLLSFSAGIRGNNPGYVLGKEVTIAPAGPDGWQALVDEIALGKRATVYQGKPISAADLWCEPGGGYSYATASIHLASILVRHVTGRELQAYVQEKLARPLGWGRWTYAYRSAREVTHTPGGGGIALRATDMLRFGYLLLHEGRWQDRPIVPAAYLRHCRRQSPYNPHYPYSLQFNVNTRGEVPELPRDAFWKTGSGGHCLYVVPSAKLVVWKLAGRDSQYSPADIGLPVLPHVQAAQQMRPGPEPSAPRSVYSRTLRMVLDSLAEE